MTIGMSTYCEACGEQRAVRTIRTLGERYRVCADCAAVLAGYDRLDAARQDAARIAQQRRTLAEWGTLGQKRGTA